MLVKNVYLFSGAPLQHTSDIRISGNLIAETAPLLHPLPGETVIDGGGKIALPGMADAHRHVWQAPFKGIAADMMLLEYLDKAVGHIGSRISPEDLYTINLYGYLEAAAAGVTLMYDWSHIMNTPEHAAAALAAAEDAGVNVLFFHGGTAVDRQPWWNNSELRHSRDIERMALVYRGHQDIRVGMGMRGPEFATIDTNADDLALAASLDIPVSMHIGSSILGRIHCPVLQLAERGLLHDRMNMVHCNTISGKEMKLLQEAGCLVTMTPEAEMQMGLGDPASLAILDVPGLKWSAGIDIATAATNSLLFQVRLLMQHYRGAVNNRLIERIEFPMQMPYLCNDFFFDAMENAHVFAGLQTSARIEPGAKACFSLVECDEPFFTAFRKNPAFYYLQEHHIRTVISNGRVIVDNGEWTGHDMPLLKEKTGAVLQNILA